jgi:predicted RNA-binding Zn ribbon-like protein
MGSRATGDDTGFWFESGHVALDFSLSGGREWRSRWERLHTPADLDAWLAQCSLGVSGIESTRRDLAAAHDLREGLWVVSQAVASGETPSASAIEIVNDHADRPALRRRFTADGSAQWAKPTARAALASIANAAIELLSTDVDESGFRRCEGERCHLLFVDTSPARRRRWCSMQRCGNRHKVRTHRAKQSS